MQLLRLGDVPVNAEDRVYRYSAGYALAGTIALAMLAGWAVATGMRNHVKIGSIIGGALFLTLLLMGPFIAARFRPTNWLVRATGQGLYIQLRSYMNFRLPEADQTVVFVPYGEIRSARLVRQKSSVSSMSGEKETRMMRLVELELCGDTTKLAKAIAAELVRDAPQEKRFYGKSSTLYRHYPVRMFSPTAVRVEWDVVPSWKKFLETLQPYTRIEETVSLKVDYANLKGLSQEQQEKKLFELDAQGETIAAIYAARQLYGCGLAEGKALVEGLRTKGRSGVMSK